MFSMQLKKFTVAGFAIALLSISCADAVAQSMIDSVTEEVDGVETNHFVGHPDMLGVGATATASVPPRGMGGEATQFSLRIVLSDDTDPVAVVVTSIIVEPGETEVLSTALAYVLPTSWDPYYYVEVTLKEDGDLIDTYTGGFYSD